MDKNDKWIPEIGETYWYVSVPYSWNFESTEPLPGERKNDGTLIFNGKNFFKTKEEAIEMSNRIRALWGYPPMK